MRTAAALLAVLALSSCASFGLEPAPDADAPADTPEGEAPAAAEDAGPLPPSTPSASGPAADEAGEEIAAAPGPALPEPGGSPAPAADAPHVYMALQPERGGRTSIVFAIDTSRDNTPSDEPAVRITPEETEAQTGRCNPQQLRYYRFPPESAAVPVYGPDEASRGVAAKDLPGFMATAVSSEMIERGIADDLEQTRPQNVCTRKLFEQTIIAATTGQG
jgi:hypothetical protein